MKYLASVLAATVTLSPSLSRAEAATVLHALGTGFTDTTPVRPIGGNSAKTLGMQRKLAVQKAIDIWAQLLDSAVPIEVEAYFTEMGCTEQGGVLASANAIDLFQLPQADGSTSGPWYHAALANKLAGRLLAPGEADVRVRVNLSVDGSCERQLDGFYYGLDGNHGVQPDLIQVLLHEVAHGLGFGSFVDVTTGESVFDDEVDVFTSHVHDLELDKSWSDLTPAQRVVSAGRTRRVVWDGPEAQRQAAKLLRAGTPTLSFTPSVTGFSGTVSAVFNVADPSSMPVTAPLVQASPENGCPTQSAAVKGAIALVAPDGVGCRLGEAIVELQRAGAVGVLLIIPSKTEAPAVVLADSTLLSTLPVVTLSQADGARIAKALARGPIVASLGGDPKQLLGADTAGRPLLFTPSPLMGGSSISHFDTSAAPDLLMEPYANDDAAHQVDLTLAVLRDIGWTAFCGNGTLDKDEQCDEGPDNSDMASATCRTSCLRSGCGDGIVVAGESCDLGRDNSDVKNDACRSDCRLAHCGDNVVDRDEACDSGPQNSDSAPGACRSNCQPARCGDGVVDTGESCDGGPQCAPDCTVIVVPPPPPPPPANMIVAMTGTPFTSWSGTDEAPPPKQHDGGCSALARNNASGTRHVAWSGLLALLALVRRAGRRRRLQSASMP